VNQNGGAEPHVFRALRICLYRPIIGGDLRRIRGTIGDEHSQFTAAFEGTARSQRLGHANRGIERGHTSPVILRCRSFDKRASVKPQFCDPHGQGLAKAV
jgi:hypothetical protein